MKKLFTLASVIIFSAALSAQSIVPTPNDSVAVTGNVADEFDPFDAHIHVVNNYGSAVTFTWGLIAHSAPSAWELKLCDNNNCYDLLLGSPYHTSLNVNSGDTMDMKFQFSPHCVAGTGNANVVVYITDDSAATAIVLNYRADLTTSCANGVTTIQKNNLKIYPNPVRNAFTVSGLENTANYAFEVYDMKGMLVRSEAKAANTGGLEISVTNMPAGDYLLKAFDQKGNIAGTSRITKVD